jgi:hypothetical protein
VLMFVAQALNHHRHSTVAFVQSQGADGIKYMNAASGQPTNTNNVITGSC